MYPLFFHPLSLLCDRFSLIITIAKLIPLIMFLSSIFVYFLLANLLLNWFWLQVVYQSHSFLFCFIIFWLFSFGGCMYIIIRKIDWFEMIIKMININKNHIIKQTKEMYQLKGVQVWLKSVHGLFSVCVYSMVMVGSLHEIRSMKCFILSSLEGWLFL